MKIFNKASVVTAGVSLVLSLCGPMVALAAGPLAVGLGTAGTFAILAKTGSLLPEQPRLWGTLA